MATSKVDLQKEIASLIEVVSAYFKDCESALGEFATRGYYSSTPEHFWSELPASLKNRAEEFRPRIIDLSQEALRLGRGSLLINDADITEGKLIAKKLLAYIRLRDYNYFPPEAIHDEGTVLGLEPPSQAERNPLQPQKAARLFVKATEDLARMIDLTDDGGGDTNRNRRGTHSVGAFRQNTAFVMMWMDPSQPELEDIRDAVVEAFRSFGVAAVRADDIEHEGVITERVITEIQTSEFLFADLSGARPNVYYEVGYAHALGKRVILFRKKGTSMHFDLAGYNCPEYENIRDLKTKLTKRLESLTNRVPGKSVAGGQTDISNDATAKVSNAQT
jgi:hypothetical protein